MKPKFPPLGRSEPPKEPETPDVTVSQVFLDKFAGSKKKLKDTGK
ncbi:hypothetical protein ACYULU_01050 [Breznakiellaceae bacterium SP9]